MRKRLGILLTAGWLAGIPAAAHVGSPYVVFDGRAGDFPVRVVVRQPEVVPGLVDLSVRVMQGTPTEVRVLPLHWNTDASGAPRPDIALAVPGQTNLFAASLWFMTRGAYGIQVQVAGPGGGFAVVPVNAVALDRKSMPRPLGAVLLVLGVVLVAGVIGIAAAAARESTLPAGIVPGRSRRSLTTAAGVISLAVVASLLYGGSAWWKLEDRQHDTQVRFRQFTHRVQAVPADRPAVLELTLTDPRRLEPANQLVPDHGKLVHLFLIGEDIDGGAPTFAHLHPVVQENATFSSALPRLPAGRYRVFTELAHEGGFTQTLTNSLELSWPTSVNLPSDSADSAAAAGPVGATSMTLGDGLIMHCSTGELRPGEFGFLQVAVVRDDGTPAPLEPYLRMLGHAVVMKDDGTVFAHVHPAGTLSMAATRTFTRKIAGENGVRVADANCGDLEAVPAEVAEALGRGGVVRFPYVFPRSGDYFVWGQVKVAGQIRTGRFRINVPRTELAQH